MAVGNGSCGPEVAGGVCNTRIYPTEVIKSVRQQMKTLTMNPEASIEVPKSLGLDEQMKAAHWKDAAVRTRQHDLGTNGKCWIQHIRKLMSPLSIVSVSFFIFVLR